MQQDLSQEAEQDYTLERNVIFIKRAITVSAVVIILLVVFGFIYVIKKDSKIKTIQGRVTTLIDTLQSDPSAQEYRQDLAKLAQNSDCPGQLAKLLLIEDNAPEALNALFAIANEKNSSSVQDIAKLRYAKIVLDTNAQQASMDQAVKFLDGINAQNLFHDTAKIYRILLYIKQKDYEGAQLLFNQVASQTNLSPAIKQQLLSISNILKQKL